MDNVNLPCDEETGEADQPADNKESNNGKDTWDEVFKDDDFNKQTI